MIIIRKGTEPLIFSIEKPLNKHIFCNVSLSPASLTGGGVFNYFLKVKIMKNRAIVLLTLYFVFAGISCTLSEKRVPESSDTLKSRSEEKEVESSSSKNTPLVPRHLQPKLRPYFMASNPEFWSRNLGKSVSVKGVVVRTKMGIEDANNL